MGATVAPAAAHEMVVVGIEAHRLGARAGMTAEGARVAVVAVLGEERKRVAEARVVAATEATATGSVAETRVAEARAVDSVMGVAAREAGSAVGFGEERAGQTALLEKRVAGLEVAGLEAGPEAAA